MSDQVLAMIDGAIGDWETSSDAMRWVPEEERTKDGLVIRLDNREGEFVQTGGPIFREGAYLVGGHGPEPFVIPELTDEQRAAIEERFRAATAGLRTVVITIKPVLESFADSLRSFAEAVRHWFPHVDGKTRARRQQMHRDYRARQLARRRRNR